MMNGLLFAAGALFLAMGVIMVFGIVDNYMKRTETMRILTQFTAEAQAQSRIKGQDKPLYDAVMESGSLPDTSIVVFGQDKRFVLPYTGVVDIFDDVSNRGYVVTVVFPVKNDKAVSMCEYLSRGTAGEFQNSGPLGVAYAIGIRSCNGGSSPLFTVVYKR